MTELKANEFEVLMQGFAIAWDTLVFNDKRRFDRPRDRTAYKTHYSGKRKTYTVKDLISMTVGAKCAI